MYSKQKPSRQSFEEQKKKNSLKCTYMFCTTGLPVWDESTNGIRKGLIASVKRNLFSVG